MAPKIDKKATAAWDAARARNVYAETGDSRGARVIKFARRNIAVIAAGLVLVIVWSALSGVGSGRDSTLAAQRGEITTLTQQLSQTQDEALLRRDKAVTEATGGVSATRKAADDEVMVGLMKQALDWNGLNQYLKRREAVMKDWDVAADSEFMLVFMPGEAEGAVRTAPSGKTYSSFDEGISSKFVSLVSYVVGMEGDTYEYFALVTMRSKSASGAAEATGQVAMTYSMVESKPVNIDAYVVPGGIARSGG